MVFVHQYKGALKAKEETIRLKDEELSQKQRQRRLKHLEFQLWIGSFFSIALIFMIGLGVGAIAGMNIPDGAACRQGNLFCVWGRFRQPKVEIPGG